MNIKMIMEGAGAFQDEATKNINPMIEQYSTDMRERQNVMLLREIFSLTWEALGFYLKYRGDAKELEELHNRPKPSITPDTCLECEYYGGIHKCDGVAPCNRQHAMVLSGWTRCADFKRYHEEGEEERNAGK